MATSRREAAAAKRLIGADQFAINYHPIQDVSMPAVAPTEDALRNEVSLQQGPEARNLNPVDGPIYQRIGFEGNAQYMFRHAALNAVREAAVELNQVVDLVATLPPGFRISPAFNLNGLSLGEIVVAIQAELGVNVLRGLYLDAVVVDLDLVGKRAGIDVEDGRPIIHFNQSITTYHTRRLPLWQVRPVMPRNEEFPHGFSGGSLDERRIGFENTMRILYGDEHLIDEFDIDFEGSDSDLGGFGNIGSDLSSYYIIANARLVRRVRAPVYMDQRTSSIRTGGFSELLTETTFITIELDEVVDAYVEHERLNTVDVMESYVSEFRRVVGQLFTLDVFTLESKTITLIVPGGTQELQRGGCCVDIATLAFLKREFGEDQAQLFSFDIRDRFEDLYVDFRCRKKKASKKRGRDEIRPSSLFPPKALPEERRGYLRDLRNTTAHGYSSQIFKFYQTAVHCVTGYLPCIYYHRIEKARDYNQGVRVRMVQVGGGVVGKELAKEYVEEGNQVSEEEGLVPYHPINMMRINIGGEIHRHKPKSLCMEESAEFIQDDDTTGLLHAITLYPGLPEDFFKGINAKRREVLLSVIEKKTIELMSHCKLLSVGMVTMIPEMMEDAVKEQIRRQDTGVTNTLIYGSIEVKVPETPQAEEEPIISIDSGPTIYYSNSYDREGRKIPDRPLVIAYDLETVELTSDAVRAGVVGPEFLKDNPDSTKYIECERQIPFCVSWVPVNLADEGRHRKLKEDILARGDPCAEIRKEEEWAGEWTGSDKFVFCSDGRRVRNGYVMLSEVKVHYGDGFLGRCVNEFIDSVVQWAMDRGYTSVCAYAHNGVGFDSYVVQAYNTKYEYQSILKTSRGILSMRMKVPFITTSSQRKTFPFTFLDTKVFLSFSLSKLCSDFKVPDEWSKLDFPITKITWLNCFHPDVVKVLEPYSINDTRALAYIIKQINRIVCLETEVVHIPGSDELPMEAHADLVERRTRRTESESGTNVLIDLHPPTPNNPKPPIAQFCTIMSCVKRVAAEYMRRTRQIPSHFLTRMPSACDLPVIRHWIEMASMGGRVSPYAKMYCSSRWGSILDYYMKGGHKNVALIIQEAIEDDDVSQVLDETSLYPSAMAYCAMPMGSLRYLTPMGCMDAINVIGCDICEKLMQLCPEHRTTVRPFAVVLIKGGLTRCETWKEMNKDNPTRHFVGRKMKGRKERGGVGSSCKIPGIDVSGIIYTNEEDDEMTKRYWSEQALPDTVLGENQAYTNVDLYWALKSGFEFEIVGGYEWETSYELQPLILTLFRMRVAAKEEGNTCLQQAIKLLLNSLFGVHSQRVIRNVDKIITLPESIREADVLEEEFARYIRANHQKIFDPRMKLKENIPLANGQSMIRAVIPGDIGEGVGGYSPNHIGCAVLAWSRHIMSLVMYKIPTGHLTYTDTDSIAVSEWWYKQMLNTSEISREHSLLPLICTKGNDLMTFKNDHGDYFPKARVLFSAIGAKKVKMHVIGCPDTGALIVCSTFKGFLKKDTLDNGDKLHPDHHKYTMAKALLDILYTGKPAPYEGTRWSRALGIGGGITIDKGVHVEGESYTYLGKHRGFAFAGLANSPSSVLLCVPFGTELQSLTTATGIRGDTLEYMRPSRALKRHSPSFIMQEFVPPHQFNYDVPHDWHEQLTAHMGGVTRERMYSFIEKMYLSRKDLYEPAPQAQPAAEGEKTWGQILSVFNEVEAEEEGLDFPEFLLDLPEEEDLFLESSIFDEWGEEQDRGGELK